MPSTSTASASGLMLTSSKDTFMKLWDLSTQHCMQTIVAHRSEIWTMDVDRGQNLIFTGSGEGELKAWSIDHGALSEGLKETEIGEVDTHVVHLKIFNSLISWFLGRQNDSPHCKPPPCLSAPCLPNIIPPNPTISCCPVPRSVRRNLSDTNGRGDPKETI